jgi:hypothetical protein
LHAHFEIAPVHHQPLRFGGLFHQSFQNGKGSAGLEITGKAKEQSRRRWIHLETMAGEANTKPSPTQDNPG